MKRIARQSPLLSKRRVKISNRRLNHYKKHNSFYTQLASMSPGEEACVVRSLGGIGDILMITPSLREIKRQFPHIKLNFAIDMHSTGNNVYYQLLKNAPFIDQFLDARYVVPNKYKAYKDISAVCIKYERKDLPSINRIDLFARALGIPMLKNKLPFYKTEPNEVKQAKQILSKHRYTKLVALHTASFSDKRTLPINKYLNVVNYFAKHYPDVLMLVFDFNRKYGTWHTFDNVLDLSKTTIREMAAYISLVDLFVGPDSGPMHIAGALNTKSLVVFGNIPPEARINYYRNHTAIQNTNLSCLGCWYTACTNNHACMNQLSVKQLINQMISLLEE